MIDGWVEELTDEQRKQMKGFDSPLYVNGQWAGYNPEPGPEGVFIFKFKGDPSRIVYLHFDEIDLAIERGII